MGFGGKLKIVCDGIVRRKSSKAQHFFHAILSTQLQATMDFTLRSSDKEVGKSVRPCLDALNGPVRQIVIYFRPILMAQLLMDIESIKTVYFD